MLPLILALVIAVSDQVTKQVVRDGFMLGESRVVIDGFFNLTYVRNTGAAWGILGGQNLSLTLLSVVMLAVMVFFRRSFLNDTLSHRIAFGLMVGGIVGNLLDRVRLAYVTDFLDFHLGGHHWPAFNIADSAICVGVGVYMVTTVLAGRHEHREGRALPPDAEAGPREQVP
jgi:signal peptidase II